MKKESAEEKAVGRTSRALNLVYLRSILNSAGTGAASPFAGVFAVRLGATSEDMGWFTSLLSATSASLQVLWGILSDRVGRRIPFVLAGAAVSSLLWIPMLASQSVWEYITLAWFQALTGSMAVPTWTALVGEVIPAETRGVIIANINLWGSSGSLGATVISGTVSTLFEEGSKAAFQLPFLLAAALGTVGALAAIPVGEKHGPKKPRRALGVVASIKDMMTSKDFVVFSSYSAVYGYVMSIAWPLFSIAVVEILDASLLEISLASVTQGLFVLIFQRWSGIIADRVGRIPMLVVSRTSLFLFPLAYVLASSMTEIILVNAVLAPSIAFINTAIFAYLLDVTPSQERASYVAFYNLLFGLSNLFGALTGGYLCGYLRGHLGLVKAIQTVLLISAAGRLVAGLAFKRIEEKYKYPSTLRQEVKKLGRSILERMF